MAVNGICHIMVTLRSGICRHSKQKVSAHGREAREAGTRGYLIAVLWRASNIGGSRLERITILVMSVLL
jgi:hypothetical protein